MRFFEGSCTHGDSGIEPVLCWWTGTISSFRLEVKAPSQPRPAWVGRAFHRGCIGHAFSRVSQWVIHKPNDWTQTFFIPRLQRHNRFYPMQRNIFGKSPSTALFRNPLGMFYRLDPSMPLCALGFSGIFWSALGCSSVLLGFLECSGMVLDVLVCSWVFWESLLLSVP